MSVRLQSRARTRALASEQAGSVILQFPQRAACTKSSRRAKTLRSSNTTRRSRKLSAISSQRGVGKFSRIGDPNPTPLRSRLCNSCGMSCAYRAARVSKRVRPSNAAGGLSGLRLAANGNKILAAALITGTQRLPAESRQGGIATECRLMCAAELVGQAVSPANCEI